VLHKLVAEDMGAWYQNAHKKKLDVEQVDSHLLQQYLRDGNYHPAKQYPDLFSTNFPDAVLTYEKSRSMGPRRGILGSLKDPRVQEAQSSDGKRTGCCLLVYINVFFNDQLCKSSKLELGISQEYFMLSYIHIVVGSPTLLDCGQCLWELGLRSYAGKDSLVIGELLAKVRTACLLVHIPLILISVHFCQGRGYDFYGNMKLSDDADREVIELGLKRAFNYKISKINEAIAAQVLSSNAPCSVLAC
jgi:hypothetical protein